MFYAHEIVCVFYPLVSHMGCTSELALFGYHTAPCAIGWPVAMEIETMREGWLVEQVRGQIILKSWREREKSYK